jgi:hypothetical protein
MATRVTANELSVETRRAGAHTIVIVTGRVTVDSSAHLRPVLREAIGTAPPAGVVIDFTAARYVDPPRWRRCSRRRRWRRNGACRFA